MVLSNTHQAIIDKLYLSYKTKGYICEEEALNLISSNDVTLKDTERLTGLLLSLGVIFSNVEKQTEYDYFDFGFIDYDIIYNEIIQINNDLESLISYIRKIKPPQRHEFENLYQQSKSGNYYAKNRIIEMNMRQALRHALYFSKRFSYPIEECIQEAFYGLIKGYENFDITKSPKFIIYITWCIRQTLYRESLIGNYLIKSPVHLKSDLFKVFRLFRNRSETFKNRNKNKIVNKICQILSCHKGKALIIFNCYQTIMNIDYMKNTKNYLHDYGENENRLMERITNSQLNENIKLILSTMPLKEQIVIINRFGIDMPEPLILEDIGKKLGVTRERIRQIEAKAFRRLRHPKRQRHLIKCFDHEVKVLSDENLPKEEKFIEK